MDKHSYAIENVYQGSYDMQHEFFVFRGMYASDRKINLDFNTFNMVGPARVLYQI
jgi:hypothetical protein